MPEAMALNVQAPQIDAVSDFQKGAATQLQFNEENRRALKQQLSQLASVAMGAKGGDRKGAVDPQKWAQGMSFLSQASGEDYNQFISRPDMADIFIDASLDTMQQIAISQDERDFNQRLREFGHRVSQAAQSNSLAREKFEYQKQQDQAALTRQAAEQEANRLALANAPAKPNSALGKLAADYNAGLIDEETYKAALSKETASSNGITITNPDGSTTQIGGSSPKLTEGQSKNASFLVRARNSNAVLNELETEGTDFMAKVKQAVPFNVGNYMQSSEYQKYDQAKRDFINAQLRKESGAVISDQEFANAEIQYFPQPGDGPEVIEQKRRNRQDAIMGFEIGAGPGAAMVPEVNNDGWIDVNGVKIRVKK